MFDGEFDYDLKAARRYAMQASRMIDEAEKRFDPWKVALARNLLDKVQEFMPDSIVVGKPGDEEFEESAAIIAITMRTLRLAEKLEEKYSKEIQKHESDLLKKIFKEAEPGTVDEAIELSVEAESLARKGHFKAARDTILTTFLIGKTLFETAKDPDTRENAKDILERIVPSTITAINVAEKTGKPFETPFEKIEELRGILGLGMVPPAAEDIFQHHVMAPSRRSRWDPSAAIQHLTTRFQYRFGQPMEFIKSLPPMPQFSGQTWSLKIPGSTMHVVGKVLPDGSLFPSSVVRFPHWKDVDLAKLATLATGVAGLGTDPRRTEAEFKHAMRTGTMTPELMARMIHRFDVSSLRKKTPILLSLARTAAGKMRNFEERYHGGRGGSGDLHQVDRLSRIVLELTADVLKSEPTLEQRTEAQILRMEAEFSRSLLKAYQISGPTEP